MNASGEAVRGLVKRVNMAAPPLARSQIPPATQAIVECTLDCLLTPETPSLSGYREIMG